MSSMSTRRSTPRPEPTPAATRTITTITTSRTITETRHLLRLLAWLSPAFPTGGFAYSHGIEWAVAAGDIGDAASLRAWVEDVLRHGAGRSDAILLRHAHQAAAAADLDTLIEVAELALAAQPSRERQAETAGQGNAFVLAAASWQPDLLRALAARVDDVAYPVAVGTLAGAHRIDVEAAAAATLQAFAANLISAAVRLVPLGQSAGLSVLATLEDVVAEVATITRGATLDDIGGACFRSDLAALCHEAQYTRLFRS